MVALNYARDVRIGDKPARAVALGSNFVWPALPERLFLHGQTLNYDFARQRYGTRLPDGTIVYTTNVNDLGIVTRASTATYWGPEGSLLEAAVDEARIQHDPVTGEPLGVLVESEATNNLVPSQGPTSGWRSVGVGSLENGSGMFGLPSVLASDPSTSAARIRSEARGGMSEDTFVFSGIVKYTLPWSQSAAFRVSGDGHDFRWLIGDPWLRPINDATQPGSVVNLGGGSFLFEVWGDWLGEIPSAAYAEAYLGPSSDDQLEVTAFQLEGGTRATSYIPTIDSPVTRAADNAVIDLSDVFNPDEGTLRITAQVPEGEVVASLGDRHVISDSDEPKSYDLNYILHSENPVAQLGEGIFNKVEYFPIIQEETVWDLVRTLYGNGEQGAMYIPKPQVLGHQVLYQDAAGTVPVMNDGDPVGCMQDLSGNGNHATQSTSARRPIYPGLSYNGVDDRLRGALSLSSSTSASVMAVSKSYEGGTRWVVNIGESPSAVSTLIFLRPSGSASSGVRVGGEINVTHSFEAPLGEDVLTEIHVYPDRVEFWLNGVLLHEEAIQVPEFNFTGHLSLGLDNAGNGPWVGDIGPLVFRNVGMSESEKKSARQYLASLAGITLEGA